MDQRDPTPLFEQLASILRDKIASGEITDVLPSNRTLRETYGVGEHAVTHAIQILEVQGLVFTIPRRGVYVRQGRDASP